RLQRVLPRRRRIALAAAEDEPLRPLLFFRRQSSARRRLHGEGRCLRCALAFARRSALRRACQRTFRGRYHGSGHREPDGRFGWKSRRQADLKADRRANRLANPRPLSRPRFVFADQARGVFARWRRLAVRRASRPVVGFENGRLRLSRGRATTRASARPYGREHRERPRGGSSRLRPFRQSCHRQGRTPREIEFWRRPRLGTVGESDGWGMRMVWESRASDRRFVSGHRFSDAAWPSKLEAPLGAAAGAELRSDWTTGRGCSYAT